MRFIFTKSPSAGLGPAIFLDRDGVMNQRIVGGYVGDWHHFRFVRGIKGALVRLSKLGVPLIVISNQAGVGKGIVSKSALRQITLRFVRELAVAGAHIDAVYYCLHTTEDNCSCRKPRPGLLKQAAQDWRLDLKSSVMIGDSLSDTEAARAVNCRAILMNPTASPTSPLDCPAQAGLIVVREPSELPHVVRRLLAGQAA